MKLIYPAIFEPWDKGEGYTVTFPDLQGVATEGETLADAMLMAEDAASLWVLDEIEEGRPAPAASGRADVTAPEGAFVNLVALDIGVYAEKYGNKAIRKNVTIPAWLNAIAEKQQINYSFVLQEGLKGRLGIQ